MKNYLIVLALMTVVCSPYVALAQDVEGGRIVFTDPKAEDDEKLSEEDQTPKWHAWAVDLMVGTDGFGLGFTYAFSFDDVLSANFNFSITEAKDDRQVDYTDPYGGQYSPNKLNYVFRMPFFGGLNYRLFSETIAENFRPYVSAGAGPVMLYVSRSKGDFFSSLGGGDFHWTFGGYVGGGALFGFDRTRVLGVNIKYFMIPVPDGIQSVIYGPLDNADGFYISLNVGQAF